MNVAPISRDSSKTNLLDLDAKALNQFFMDRGEKSFRSVQLFKWIYQRGIIDFEQMTDLSKNLRQILPEIAEITMPKIVHESCSLDGTRKWLIRLYDNNHIETVFIPEKERGTLCVSSQVGCALNCSFCSTGKQGFNRNLQVSEIIGQVWLASQRLREVETRQDRLRPAITNVVMMGMGEPLLNFEPVVAALSIMRDDNAYALPRRRVTLSTAGLIPKIDRLSEESDVSLALSLHAPNDELRNEIVPLNKKYPIAELMNACRRYARMEGKAERHITMEYVMLKDVNDSLLHAKQLIEILKGVPCKINLIPFNPFTGTEYQRSTIETIMRFQAKLVKAGFIVTVRRTRGGDIDAACGQLKGRVIDRTSRSLRWNLQRKNEMEKEETTCFGKEVTV